MIIDTNTRNRGTSVAEVVQRMNNVVWQVFLLRWIATRFTVQIRSFFSFLCQLMLLDQKISENNN